MGRKYLFIFMVFSFVIVLTVYGGYKLGNILIGTIVGIVLAGGITYVSLRSSSPENTSTKTTEQHDKSYPVIEVGIDEVRKVVRNFSDKLPKGVYRTILVQEDNSIDFNQLAPFLGGIPSKKFYMSKETYDLFEEHEKHIAVEMDIVQKAVDLYVKDHKEYPMLPFDPLHRVNYYQLLQDHYLKRSPEIPFYLTDLDGLITHIKPQKKNSSQS